jgi:uncharacterized protein (TIGR00251 family)
LSDEPASLKLDRNRDGVAFWIHVTPRSRQAKVGGLHADALRVSVAAAPVEGQANAACGEALANALGCRRRDVEIDPGSKSRRKRVRVFGTPADLEVRLRALAKAPGVG